MTGSIALDIVIGLIFIYLLYSLLATIIQELIANTLNLRGRILKQAIQRMLDDNTDTQTFSNKFYNAPLIKYMVKKDGKRPAYLASRNFSKVVVDILRGVNPQPGDDFKLKIDNALAGKIDFDPTGRIVTGGTFDFLRSLWADSNGDIEKFKSSLEQWYDDTMERASSWYKRSAQFILFFIGLTIAGIFNVDTIAIIGKLSKDPELRQQLVQQADAYVKEHPHFEEDLRTLQSKIPKEDTAKLKETEDQYEAYVLRKDSLVKAATQMVNNDIKNVNQLLGVSWSDYKGSFFQGVYRGILGWIITAFAISLGAPFWFDLLNKLMKVRGPVPPAQNESKAKTSDGKVIIPKG